MSEEQYVNVPFRVLKSPYMNIREKLLYSWISSFFDGDFVASNDYIGKVMDCTARQAQRLITSLKKKGLVTVERVYDENNYCKGRITRIKKKI